MSVRFRHLSLRFDRESRDFKAIATSASFLCSGRFPRYFSSVPEWPLKRDQIYKSMPKFSVRNQLAEREGFEPSVQVLARTTV
jgi:hypothetical protein